jgi:uncharacterized membrane protein
MASALLAFPIGVVAGLRSMTAPAAVSWAARLGLIRVKGTPLAFLAHPVTPYVLTALALGEIIADKLPNTPSRKSALPFSGRIATGALSGAAIGASANALTRGLLVGALGAVAGTLGGYEGRMRTVQSTGGKDLPVALAEDLIAVGGAATVLSL